VTSPTTTSPATAERLAAIDVGSNSIRLVVAEYHHDTGLSIIDEVKEQPRLAAGVASSGALDPVASEHAVQALRRMVEVCQRRDVKRVRAVATSAVREAANGDAFLERVRTELGLELEIIDGQTEALLSYRSVAHHFPLTNDRTIIADIGGGSLELVGAVDGLIELSRSLPLGAVRLTEMYLNGASRPFRQIKELRREIRKQLRRGLEERDWTAANLIGSGGTFTNLARMAAARRGKSAADPVHGVTVATGEVEHLLERLTSMKPDERAQVPGLNPNRADIILAGLAVVAELLDMIDGRRVAISAFGLREGLLLEMAGATAPPASEDPLRLAREFAHRCGADLMHAEQVRFLALILFDYLAEPLGADHGESAILEAAAVLHEVGQLVSYREHHKHSFQLILHAERLNLPARDRLMVAHVSRYHRKRGPTKKHREFASLNPAEQGVVRRMSALLRVADGLDRGGSAAVGSLAVDIQPDQLTITIRPKQPGADLELERWTAERKGDVLGKLLGRPVRVVQG